MPEFRGTLDIVKENNQDWYEIKSEFEIELMIERIIPSHHKFPLQVRVHPENTQMLRMIMREYPLQILTDKWDEKQEEILKVEKLKTVLSKLEYVEPNKANFTGTLYPFQKEGLDFLTKCDGICLITDEMGLGKAQPLDAKILTPSGWKTMGEIKCNDTIISESGDVIYVKNIFPQGIKEIFKITFSDGSYTECCNEHLWSVYSRGIQKGNRKLSKVLELSEIKKELTDSFGNSKYFIPIIKPVKFNEKKLPIDPYILGCLLGDGNLSSNSTVISTNDLEITDSFNKILSKNGLILKHVESTYDFRIIKKEGNSSTRNWLVTQLKKLNLSNCNSKSKFIPEMYKLSSIEQRVSIFQGLMDTDGHVSKDGMILQFTTISELLLNDIKFIIQSLGGTARLSSKIPSYSYKGKKLKGQKAYTLTISLPPEIMPFRLWRKKTRFKPKTKYPPYRAIKSIEYVGEKEAKCISVSGIKKLYVTDDFIVTHNTWETLAFLSTRPDAFPAVVIAPLVTLTNWKRESEKLLRLDKSVDSQQKLTGIENKIPIVEIIREGKMSNLPPADIYVINYDLMTKRLKNITDMNPRTIIADECHALRNSDTKRYSACKALAYHPTVKYRMGLSGTPLYNRGFEMFNIVEVLKAGLLGDGGEFYRRYCDRYNSGMTKDDAKSGLSDFLKKTIMLRRRKSDVLPDLPDKIKMKQTIDIDKAKYHGELTKLYKEIDLIKEQMLTGTLTEDSKKDGLFAINKKIREMTIAERQIAGLAKAPFVVKYLIEMFEDYVEEKFVVFCHHLSVHKILMDALWKFNPVQIVGGQTDKERQAAIDSFQNDKKTRVIICGLRAGSLGINLTSAAYVIFAELDWSPSIHAQAEDRLHRIGQKNKVFAHYLEGAGTFDEILSQVLMRKTYVISDALGEKMEKLNNKMALEYLEEKFKISEKSKLSKILNKDFSG